MDHGQDPTKRVGYPNTKNQTAASGLFLDRSARWWKWKVIHWLSVYTIISVYNDFGFPIPEGAGMAIDPLRDLNAAAKKALGKLVEERYDTQFYMLHGFPAAVRPFFTMPCFDSADYCNSFDAFIRGEEIISGAQRCHIPELLTAQALSRGIDVDKISEYIDSFRYSAPMHGGFGVGVERANMLLLGLNNIRCASLFPRDPKRIIP